MHITSVVIQPLTKKKSCVGVASVVFDHSFIVKDIRLIQVESRRLLAMPSRKSTARCTACGEKCFRDANYCPNCGTRLTHPRAEHEPAHHDIAHPLTKEMRELLERTIWAEYEKGTYQFSGAAESSGAAAAVADPRRSSLNDSFED